MSRRRRLGVNTLFQMLVAGKIKDIHHLVPRGEGGSNKKSNKMEGNALDHRLWHLFVKNSSSSQDELDEAAEKCSTFISRNSRFFALSKDPLGNSLYKTVQKMNQWLGNDDFKIKVVFKRSKIIRFPRQKYFPCNLPKTVS